MKQRVEIQLFIKGSFATKKFIYLNDKKAQIEQWKKLYGLHHKDYEIFIVIQSKFCK